MAAEFTDDRGYADGSARVCMGSLSPAPMEGLPQYLIALFADTRLAYTNGRDHPEIQPLIAMVGYAPARLDALLAEVDAAEAEAEAREDAETHAEDATVTLGAQYLAARKRYMRHVKLARTVFDPGTRGYRVLGLRGKRADARRALLSQADEFYRALGKEAGLLAELEAEVSIGQPAIDAQLAAVHDVRERLAARARAKGGSEDTTQSRDGLAAEVETEWGRFRKRARVALEGRPQLLEVLGIATPS